MEVFTGAGRRRAWSADEKARIVAESYNSGESVSAVARRHALKCVPLGESSVSVSVTVAAVNGQMVRRLVVSGGGAGVEVEAGQVEHVVLAEEIDRVGEVVSGQGGVLDLESLPAGLEGDRAVAGRCEGGEVERAGF
jgi:hypothetical protein